MPLPTVLVMLDDREEAGRRNAGIQGESDEEKAKAATLKPHQAPGQRTSAVTQTRSPF